jgi:hypothetical protein
MRGSPSSPVWMPTGKRLDTTMMRCATPPLASAMEIAVMTLLGAFLRIWTSSATRAELPRCSAAPLEALDLLELFFIERPMHTRALPDPALQGPTGGERDGDGGDGPSERGPLHAIEAHGSL